MKPAGWRERPSDSKSAYTRSAPCALDIGMNAGRLRATLLCPTSVGS